MNEEVSRLNQMLQQDHRVLSTARSHNCPPPKTVASHWLLYFIMDLDNLSDKGLATMNRLIMSHGNIPRSSRVDEHFICCCLLPARKGGELAKLSDMLALRILSS